MSAAASQSLAASQTGLHVVRYVQAPENITSGDRRSHVPWTTASLTGWLSAPRMVARTSGLYLPSISLTNRKTLFPASYRGTQPANLVGSHTWSLLWVLVKLCKEAKAMNVL